MIVSSYLFEGELPATCAAPGVECRVWDFCRMRNNGPMLTMAHATWKRPNSDSWHVIKDIVTRMRLADMLSQYHTLPVNNDNLYGPRGRLVPIGRK